MHDNLHSKLEQKKPTKYILNFWYISEVSDIYIYAKIHSKLEQENLHKFCEFPICIERFQCLHATKYTLNWNKNRLQNMSKIFDVVYMSQVGNLAEVSGDFRDIIW